MKAIGYGLIALPFVAFVLVGLIFDTADFLIAMAVVACVAVPILIGGWLIERSTR